MGVHCLKVRRSMFGFISKINLGMRNLRKTIIGFPQELYSWL